MRCSCGSTKVHNHKQKLARYLLRHLDPSDNSPAEQQRAIHKALKSGYNRRGMMAALRRDAA